MKSRLTVWPPVATWALLAGSLLLSAGCDTKEKVYEVDTPAGDVKVEKSDDKVDVKVKKEKDNEKGEAKQ